MKIYTKTGDKGDTGLWGGTRVSKDAARIQAYGTVDECNALLGVVQTQHELRHLRDCLEVTQHMLFHVGSDLAAPMSVENVRRIHEKDVLVLEEWIDRFEADLPPLTQFILPGGHPSAATLHQARTVCRRAERWVVSLSHEAPEDFNSHTLTYLNRLSDLLFVAARWANLQHQVEDLAWEKQED